MADIMNDEEIGEFKKSWFLNAKVPSEDDLYEHSEGVEEWSDMQFDEYDNIVQTHWDGSSNIKTLLGCRDLNFAICQIKLKDGQLEIEAEDSVFCRKLDEYDDGWQVWCCDEELLDYGGNITEELSEFDHVEDNAVFRIPYTDLDTSSYRNGKVVLTKEAEEKWKKILSDELEQPHFGRRKEAEDNRKIASGMLSALAGELSQNKVNKDTPIEWYLNGKLPENLLADEEYSDVGFDVYGNIIRINLKKLRIELLGCRNLDFALCEIDLYDGKLNIASDPRIKYSRDGWSEFCYDWGKLRNCDGYGLKNFLDFSYATYDMDDSINSSLYRVSYADLDMMGLQNGNIVLTKEAEEKWKKILSDKNSLSEKAKDVDIKQDEKANEYFFANNVDVEKIEKSVYGIEESVHENVSKNSGLLTDYFVTINENGTKCTVALYSDSDGLYIKGDSLEVLKAVGEEKFYIQTANGFAKEFSEIKPSPETWLTGKPKGYSMEAGFCDIVSKRKKGEDSDGNFDANINKLDELLLL